MAQLTDIPLSELMQLRKMRLPDAERMLRSYDLPEDQFNNAMQLAAKDLDIDAAVSAEDAMRRSWADKRHWRATAYVLGGSLRQIATLDNVAHTSVNDSLRRVLGEGRQHERLAKRIAHEHLSAYMRAFNANLDQMRTLTPKEAAEWLQANTDLD